MGIGTGFGPRRLLLGDGNGRDLFVIPTATIELPHAIVFHQIEIVFHQIGIVFHQIGIVFHQIGPRVHLFFAGLCCNDAGFGRGAALGSENVQGAIS